MNGSLIFATTTWPEVVLALIAAAPGIIAAFYSASVRRQVRTPSGDTLGAVAERTHDMTAAGVAIVTDVQKTVNNGTATVHAPPEPASEPT